MTIVYAIMELVGGIGVFLFGCKLLSDNMEKLANKGIRNLFAKTSKNRALGVGIGTVTTVLVQSSSLTTVMVVGFVNSGIMDLFQATTIIMGANIGTTITGQIAALQAFSVSKIMMGLAGVGIFMVMLSKNSKVKSIGGLIAGLGLVFVGLKVTSSAMSLVSESEAVRNIFASISNPILLFLAGVIVTSIVQSSSAVTAIIITMAAQGIAIGSGGNSVLFVILGTNIGTCVTALLSSIGANNNAKRAAAIHLMFNIMGSAIFFIVLLLYKDFNQDIFKRVFANAGTQIAMFHTFFNVIATLLFLPFVAVFVKVSKLLIKDKPEIQEQTFLDKRFLFSPIIAIDNSVKELMIMLDKSISSLDMAVKGFTGKDYSLFEAVKENNDNINKMSLKITNYLVEISAQDLTVQDEKHISALHGVIGDIVRIGELADNILKYTDRSIKENLFFSKSVEDELNVMLNYIHELYGLAKSIVVDKKYNLIKSADEKEENIDNMRKNLIKDHIDRLNNGECHPASSSVFINLVSNLERVGDHISFIAHSMDKVEDTRVSA